MAEALEEASLNALAAETLTSFMGHTAYALLLDVLQRMMVKYHLLNEIDRVSQEMMVGSKQI